MKKVILLFLISLNFSVPINAQLYFQDGMKWITKIFSSSSFYPISFDQTVEYNTIEINPNCEVGLLTWASAGVSKDLIIKKENEQIFFRDKNNEEIWYLFYDFSLTPGEGCYVFSPISFDSEGMPYKTYIQCMEIKENDREYDNWTTMYLYEYENENLTSYPEKGVWIKNLSSANGVLQNSRFNLDGGSSKLIIAVLNDNIIYSNDAAKINVVVSPKNSINWRTDGDKLFIDCSDDVNQIKICSLKGEFFFLKKAGKGYYIELPHSGIYFLMVDDFTYKILIN